MSEDVINVSLYGGKSIFGGREQPLEAVETKCAVHGSCSLYAEGTCMNLRGFGTPGCKHGYNETTRGYTSRAKKYGEFYSKWKSHEKYNALERPRKKVGRIKDEIIINIAHAVIDNNGKISDPNFGLSDVAYIPEDEFTPKVIYDICTFRPQAIMGGEIKKYQEEEVPLFLAQMSEILPDKYKAFIDAYPEYDKEINHVGRKAYLHSVLPSIILSGKYKKDKWRWDGTLLTAVNPKRSSIIISVANEYEVDTLSIKPTEDTIVEITDNAQVGENTIFVE